VQDFRVVDLGVVLVLASSTFYLEGESLFRIAMDKNVFHIDSLVPSSSSR
jgi:hypothetical protein